MVNLTDAHVAWLVPIQSALLPLVVALVTTRVANPRVKALVLQFLVVVGTFITLALQERSFDALDFAVNFGIAYLTSQAVYENVWKRYGLADVIGRLFPNRGITTFPLTRNFAPPVIPSEDLPPIYVKVEPGVFGTTSPAPEGVEVKLHSGDEVPPVPLFDQYGDAPLVSSSGYTTRTSPARASVGQPLTPPTLDDRIGPLEDLSAVTDPLALPMEIQVRNLLMWIEKELEGGADPAELEALVCGLAQMNFDEANAEAVRQGATEQELQAFWKAVGDFGDTEPADAIDAGDE